MIDSRNHRYKRAREQAGLSIGQAAKLLGWDARALEFHEAGHDGLELDDASLQKLADIYGCSVEWLRGDHVEPPVELVKALDESNVSQHDREILLEFAASIQGMPPKPSARERVAALASKVAAEERAIRVPLTDKVQYVKSQGQTREHHCHWPGCDKQVPPAMWGCKAHWYKLPIALRNRIWRAYVPGQEATMTPSEEYLQVADDVQRWIREHGGAP